MKYSLRVGLPVWSNPVRCSELLGILSRPDNAVTEIALFTDFTHTAKPLETIFRRAEALREVIPRFKERGLVTGINHLCTTGHLDEDLDHALAEPWQHVVDLGGGEAGGCFCAADPRVAAYVRESHALLAAAHPDFLWVDDDVRLEHHGPHVSQGCFCPHCLAEFGESSDRIWTREQLGAALRDTGPESLALRKQWLEHNRAYVARILREARAGADEFAPGIPMGLMTIELGYSGYASPDWEAALAGPGAIPVKWRPGGGFYRDDRPRDLIGKIHSTGRQVGLMSQNAADVQYEHENFPYQVLGKSTSLFNAEIVAAIGAGCTGVALNIIGTIFDGLEEFEPWLAAPAQTRAFAEKAVSTCGRSACEGIWAAFTVDHFAASTGEGGSNLPAYHGGSLHRLNELSELGLPLAYTHAGAKVVSLSRESVDEFSSLEIESLLSQGVLLDAPSLNRLNERGFGHLTGFSLLGAKDHDTIERFTSHELNGRFAGYHRDCRPSFYPERSFLLRPEFRRARGLSELVDFAFASQGLTSGTFTNPLGGRIAVFGYYPWSQLLSLPKVAQLRSVMRWLSGGQLPAMLASHHRMLPWCRRDQHERPVVLLVNSSLDPAQSVILDLAGDHPEAEFTGADGQSTLLSRTSSADGYSRFELPTLAVWGYGMLRVTGPTRPTH